MIYDYMISIKLQPDTWSGNVVTQELYVRSNLPDLGKFIRMLDANASVISLIIHRILTIPTLTKLQQITREELTISEKDLVKIL